MSCHTLGRGGPWSSEGWELLVVNKHKNKIYSNKYGRWSLNNLIYDKLIKLGYFSGWDIINLDKVGPVDNRTSTD